MLGGTISCNSSLLDSSLGRSLDFGGLIEDGVLARQLGDGGGRGGAVSGNSSSLGSSLSRSLAYGGRIEGGILAGLLDDVGVLGSATSGNSSSLGSALGRSALGSTRRRVVARIVALGGALQRSVALSGTRWNAVACGRRRRAVTPLGGARWRADVPAQIGVGWHGSRRLVVLGST